MSLVTRIESCLRFEGYYSHPHGEGTRETLHAMEVCAIVTGAGTSPAELQQLLNGAIESHVVSTADGRWGFGATHGAELGTKVMADLEELDLTVEGIIWKDGPDACAIIQREHVPAALLAA